MKDVHQVAPEELMAYMDGELAPERAAAVSVHLTQCATCQAQSVALRQVSRELTAWQVEEPPQSLVPPPNAVERNTQRAPRWPFTWARPSTVAWSMGAGAFVVLVAVNAWMGSVSRRPMMSRSEALGSSTPTGEAAEMVRRSASGSPLVGRATAGRSAPPSSAAAPQVQLGDAAAAPRGPMIIRTVSLTIVTTDYDAARPAIDRVLRDVSGFIGQIQASDVANSRSFRATLRVPVSRLDEAVRSLRTLGHVVNEGQSGDDVTEQVQDLEARLANGRNTEKRLNEVLKNRTGNVADVLQVEREIARVREEIERLDAQRLNLERQVTYSTVMLDVSEQRQATLGLGHMPVPNRLRNALVDGMRDAYESGLAVTVMALRAAPLLVLWTAVLWWPARLILRMLRARTA